VRGRTLASGPRDLPARRPLRPPHARRPWGRADAARVRAAAGALPACPVNWAGPSGVGLGPWPMRVNRSQTQRASNARRRCCRARRGPFSAPRAAPMQARAAADGRQTEAPRRGVEHIQGRNTQRGQARECREKNTQERWQRFPAERRRPARRARLASGRASLARRGLRLGAGRALAQAGALIYSRHSRRLTLTRLAPPWPLWTDGCVAGSGGVGSRGHAGQ
jgi:hypothetical protein